MSFKDLFPSLQMALLDGDPYPSTKRQKQQQQRRRERHKSKHEKTFKIRILVLLFVFFALYVGLEVTYGGFILTYAVRGPPKMDKVSGPRIWRLCFPPYYIEKDKYRHYLKVMVPAHLLISNYL